VDKDVRDDLVKAGTAEVAKKRQRQRTLRTDVPKDLGKKRKDILIGAHKTQRLPRRLRTSSQFDLRTSSLPNGCKNPWPSRCQLQQKRGRSLTQLPKYSTLMDDWGNHSEAAAEDGRAVQAAGRRRQLSPGNVESTGYSTNMWVDGADQENIEVARDDRATKASKTNNLNSDT
jgi:hypothetical protein